MPLLVMCSVGGGTVGRDVLRVESLMLDLVPHMGFGGCVEVERVDIQEQVSGA